METRCQIRKCRASPNAHQMKVSVSPLLCVYGGVSVSTNTQKQFKTAQDAPNNVPDVCDKLKRVCFVNCK